MEIRDYLLDEMKRLNRINDGLEKKINQGIMSLNKLYVMLKLCVI